LYEGTGRWLASAPSHVSGSNLTCMGQTRGMTFNVRPGPDPDEITTWSVAGRNDGSCHRSIVAQVPRFSIGVSTTHSRS
jgi:hypothetical protein